MKAVGREPIKAEQKDCHVVLKAFVRLEARNLGAKTQSVCLFVCVIFIYLFILAASGFSLWHAGSLVVACT